jgi:hypothetical protein
VVGIAGLTTYDWYGTVDHGPHHNRRDFQPHLINAVVVRQWNGRDYGPGGKTVFLTNAAVTKPLQPFDHDARSLLENFCITEAKQQWELGHPPQKTEWAVWVHIVFILLINARWPPRIGGGMSKRPLGRRLWAGSAGGGTSSSRPGRKSSSSPNTVMTSFMGWNTRCSWASS